MVSVYQLKPRFQALLRPGVDRLAKSGVTANQVTVAAFILCCFCGAWIWWSEGSPASLVALPAVLFLRMALNAVDGMLAREHGQASRLGAWLNEATDIASDVVLYLPFAAIAGLDAGAALLVVGLGVLSELVGVFGLRRSGERRYDGPFGKSDRAVFFGAIALILGFGLFSTAIVDGALWAAALLAVATIVNRAWRVWRARKET